MNDFSIYLETQIYKLFILKKYNESNTYLTKLTPRQKNQLKKDLGNGDLYYKNISLLDKNWLRKFVEFYKFQNLNGDKWIKTTYRYKNNKKEKSISIYSYDRINDYVFPIYVKRFIEILSYGVDFKQLDDYPFIHIFFHRMIQNQLNQPVDSTRTCLHLIFQIPHNYGDGFYTRVLHHIQDTTAYNGYILSSYCLSNIKISPKIKRDVLQKDIICCKKLINFMFKINFKYLKENYEYWLMQFLESIFMHMKSDAKLVVSNNMNNSDNWIASTNFDSWEDYFTTTQMRYFQSEEVFIPQFRKTVVRSGENVMMAVSYERFKERINNISIEENLHRLDDNILSFVCSQIKSYMEAFYDLKYALSSLTFTPLNDTLKKEINAILVDFNMNLTSSIVSSKQSREVILDKTKLKLEKNVVYEFTDVEVEQIKNCSSDCLMQTKENVNQREEDKEEEYRKMRKKRDQQLQNFAQSIQRINEEKRKSRPFDDVSDEALKKIVDELFIDDDEVSVDEMKKAVEKRLNIKLNEDEKKRLNKIFLSMQVAIDNISINFYSKDANQYKLIVQFDLNGVTVKKPVYCSYDDKKFLAYSGHVIAEVENNKFKFVSSDGNCHFTNAVFVAIKCFYNLIENKEFVIDTSTCLMNIKTNNLLKSVDIEVA